MELTSGRFSGDIIEDADSATGAHAGLVLDDEPTPEPTFEEPEAVAPAAPPFTYDEPAAPPTPVAEPASAATPVEPEAPETPEPSPFTYEAPVLAQTAPEPIQVDGVAQSAEETAQEAAPSEPEPIINPAAFTPRVQKGATAVGVAPQTENLFAGEALAETPVAKGPANRKAPTATRSRKADPALAGAVAADALANARPRTVFDDPDAGMEPTVTEEDRLPPLNEKPKKVRADGEPTFGQRIKDGFANLGKVTTGVITGVIVGGFIAAYVVAVFGPWQVTDLGLVSKDLGSPINAVPADTVITMTHVGEVKPTGTAAFFPIVLKAAKARVAGPVADNTGSIVGYTVECISGSCPTGLVYDIPTAAILGKG